MVLLAADTTLTEGVDGFSKVAKVIGDYGFMIAFCSVAMIVVLLFFIQWERNASTRTKAELDLTTKERTASIEQNKKMFDLVTTVQTEQVAELQSMTNLLRSISDGVVAGNEKMIHASTDISRMNDTIVEANLHYKTIQDNVDEILSYVKIANHNDQEILNKVNELEKMLKEKTLK